MKHARDPMVLFRSGAAPGARHFSGHVVLDEAFLGGRVCTRYWSTAGQVVPEMYAEKTRWAVDEPADSFAVAIDGRDLAGGYEWIEAREEQDGSGLRNAGAGVVCSAVRLAHRATGMEVTVHTRLDGGPFVVRWLEVKNTSPRPASITAACPFGGMVWTRRIDEHLAPALDGGVPPSPFELAYTPDLRFIPQIAWDDDPAVRDRNYETLHARMAQQGAT